MKKYVWMSALLFALGSLAILSPVHAQTTKTNNAPQATPQTATPTTVPSNNTNATTEKVKSMTMAGMVSHDEKSFVADKDKRSYKVENPDMFTGQADHHVRITAQVDAANDQVNVKNLKELSSKAATKSKTSSNTSKKTNG
jgi:hypothetical protein